MLLTAITIAVFIIYFFYMTRFATTFVEKPSFPYVTNTAPFSQQLVSDGSKFQFIGNSSKVEWEEPLPENYILQNQKIVPGDVCQGKSDGFRVLATGRYLYDYLQNYRLEGKNDKPFETNIDHDIQDKRVFFFTCKDSEINELHMCPPGHLFMNQTCQPIDICSGQENFKRFANSYDIFSYHECREEKVVQRKCPPDTVFLFDQCVDTGFSVFYCKFFRDSKIIGPNTLLVCDNNQLSYQTCPPGHRYFDKPICEPDTCYGKPDGSLIPLPDEENGPFKFSPGYMICRDQKIASTEMCPRDWDPHLSLGDDLTHLPSVFDGKKCSVPTFCTNVTSSDPDVIVPVHEFTKDVKNWKQSEVLDSLAGYTCNPRKRVALDPGNRIGKHFKRESACDTLSHVPVPGQPMYYYNCGKKRVEKCLKKNSETTYFELPDKCRVEIKHGFSYGGRDFFSYDNLTPDNWITVFQYGDKSKHVEPCHAPESVWLQTYNVCSHPDCVNYAFLSMIPRFEIHLKDGTSKCVYDRNRRLVKEPAQSKYLYWNQREEYDFSTDTCIPGNRIQTGNFIWDSTIWVTCDDSQPFVFCPSSDTQGLTLIDGKYACAPNSQVGYIPEYTKHTFELNEVKQITIIDDPVIVKIDDKEVSVTSAGVFRSDRFTLETLHHPVRIRNRYRVTHPPEVVLGEQPKSMPSGYGFLMKLQDFTTKFLVFPEYTLDKVAIDFDY